MDPLRLTKATLDDLRKDQGAHYEAQYQQAPQISGANFIKLEWFQRYSTKPIFDYTIISIDPAFTKNGGDYSACLVCGVVGGNVYVIHAERVQYDYPALKSWIRMLDKIWSPDLIVCEAIGSGQVLVQQLREEGMEFLQGVSTGRYSKIQRMEVCTPQLEQGLVYIPESAPFLQGFLNELLAFPSGSNDDWVDSLSQLLGYTPEIILRVRVVRAQREPVVDRYASVRPHSMYYGQRYV
jgi:predicted phage terminase large subunit-like protein